MYEYLVRVIIASRFRLLSVNPVYQNIFHLPWR